MKYTITELKNTLEGFNSRLQEAEKESVIWKRGHWNSFK